MSLQKQNPEKVTLKLVLYQHEHWVWILVTDVKSSEINKQVYQYQRRVKITYQWSL